MKTYLCRFPDEDGQWEFYRPAHIIQLLKDIEANHTIQCPRWFITRANDLMFEVVPRHPLPDWLVWKNQIHKQKEHIPAECLFGYNRLTERFDWLFPIDFEDAEWEGDVPEFEQES